MINNKNWFQLRPMYSYIRKQAENKKALKYLETGGTFTLITIFLFFAILPTMTTIFSLLGEIKSKQTFIKKVDLKINNIIKAQEAYSLIQENYSTIEESFPSQPEYYSGASNLATIFRDSSVNINQINFSLRGEDEIISNDQFFKTYQLNINGEGQYPNIINILQNLLNNRRLINVSNIQISKLDVNQNGDTNDIKINLNNDLYFLPDD